ncbi:unnamed protein product [Danaus chrysippus]|nr:unnamed protein product [Danaus chrysippus]
MYLLSSRRHIPLPYLLPAPPPPPPLHSKCRCISFRRFTSPLSWQPVRAPSVTVTSPGLHVCACDVSCSGCRPSMVFSQTRSSPPPPGLPPPPPVPIEAAPVTETASYVTSGRYVERAALIMLTYCIIYHIFVVSDAFAPRRIETYRRRQSECVPRFDQSFSGACEQQNLETNALQKRFLEGKAKRQAKKTDRKPELASISSNLHGSLHVSCVRYLIIP